MPDFIFSALPGIISTITLGVVGVVAKKVTDFMRVFKEQHEVLLESQRNQLKDRIVQIYEQAVAHGFITPMMLDIVNLRGEELPVCHE